jgi:hypothetical protein
MARRGLKSSLGSEDIPSVYGDDSFISVVRIDLTNLRAPTRTSKLPDSAMFDDLHPLIQADEVMSKQSSGRLGHVTRLILQSFYL